MIKRILVALGGTPYTSSAIRHAVELGGLHGATVTGLAVIDPNVAARREPVPIGGGALAAESRARRLETLQERIETATHEFVSVAEKAGVAHRTVQSEKDAVDAIAEVWRYQDLFVAGLQGLFEYGLADEPRDALIRLIRSGVRPMLAVGREYRPVRSALLAYSGSMESAKTMKRFVQMRLWPDIEARLVHFAAPGSEYGSLLSDAAAYCLEWELELSVAALEGDARGQLVPHADSTDADLIVMGDSAHSLLTRRMFGDTTLQVLRTAERPLFLAH